MVVINKKMCHKTQDEVFYVPNTILEEESSNYTKLTKIPKYKDCQRQLDLFLSLRKNGYKPSFISPTASQKRVRTPKYTPVSGGSSSALSPKLATMPKYKDFQRQLGLCLSIRRKINNGDISSSFITPSGKSASFITPTSIRTGCSSRSSGTKLTSIPKYKDFQRELDICLSLRKNNEQPSFIITPTSESAPSTRFDEGKYDDSSSRAMMKTISFDEISPNSNSSIIDSNSSSSSLEDFNQESCLGASAVRYQNDRPAKTSFVMEHYFFPSFLFEESKDDDVPEERNNISNNISVGSETTKRFDQFSMREDESEATYSEYLVLRHHEHHDSSFFDSSVTTRRVDDIIMSRDQFSLAKEDESEDTYYILRQHENSFLLPSDAVPTTNGERSGGGGRGIPEYIFITNEC